MKESVAIAKEANRKKESSPTRSDNSIQRLRNEPERQLGSLRSVIGNIRRSGSTPSVESIATQLSSMHSAQRAPVLLALQQTHGNRYVQRVVTGIQAKLKVGQAGDIYEYEADRVAEQVMRMPEPKVQRQAEEEEEELIQTEPLVEQIAPLVQRQVEEDEELKKKKKEEEEEILQTKDASGQTPEVASDFESRIHALQGGGQPLPESVRTHFEPRFGHDFSNVLVHTDAETDKLARALNARAFTTGKDIFFRQEEYNPGSMGGRKLLAHELTHVVQQNDFTLAVLQKDVLSPAGKEAGLSFADEPMSIPEESHIGPKERHPEELEVAVPERSILGPPVEDRAHLLFTLLQAAYTDLNTNAWKWGIAANQFGLCYHDAYQAHKKTIDDQKKRDALIKDIAFTVLNLVTIGVISRISTIAQFGADLSKQWKVNAMEDISQAFFGKVLTPPKEELGMVSKDPFKFYLEIKDYLDQHVANSLSFVNNYVQWAKDVEKDVIMGRTEEHAFLGGFSADEFDNELDNWKSSILLFEAPPAVPKSELTEELEIGMWAKWAATQLFAPPNPWETYLKPGGIVEDKLCSFGINFVCGFGLLTGQSEIATLVEWGKIWMPKHPFNI